MSMISCEFHHPVLRLRNLGVSTPSIEDRNIVADTRFHLTLPCNFGIARKLEEVSPRNWSSVTVPSLNLQ